MLHETRVERALVELCPSDDVPDVDVWDIFGVLRHGCQDVDERTDAPLLRAPLRQPGEQPFRNV